MGRWAQRRVRGGGPPPLTSTTPHMISAGVIDATTLEVAWSDTVDSSTWTPAHFTIPSEGATCTAFLGTSATTVQLTFAGGSGFVDDDLLEHVGADTGILSPDSVAITV